MKLVINGRFLTRPMTGVDRVAENVTRQIDSLWSGRRGDELIVAVPHGACASLPLEHGRVEPCGRFGGNAWEQVDLPGAHPDAVLLNPCNAGPLHHANAVTVLHDAHVFDFPKSYSRAFRAWYTFMTPRLAAKSKAVITVSQHAADRLMAHGVTRERASVIENGCDHFDPDVDKTAPAPERPFILFVGSPARHKNIGLFLDVAQAFEGGGLDFIVVGASASSTFAGRAVDAEAGPNVTFLGRVEEAELARLYRHASALLFPSYVEGFGLTPLEAQRFGCPVISSDRAPMTELLGESARFADPDTPGQWTLELRSILGDEAARARLVEAGRVNAARFTWARAGERYLQVIDKVAGAARPSGDARMVEAV